MLETASPDIYAMQPLSSALTSRLRVHLFQGNFGNLAQACTDLAARSACFPMWNLRLSVLCCVLCKARSTPSALRKQTTPYGFRRSQQYPHPVGKPQGGQAAPFTTQQQTQISRSPWQKVSLIGILSAHGSSTLQVEGGTACLTASLMTQLYHANNEDGTPLPL